MELTVLLIQISAVIEMLVDESRNQLIVTKASAAHDYSRIVSGFQFLGYFVARICISHGPLWSKIKPRTLLIKDKKKRYCTCILY